MIQLDVGSQGQVYVRSQVADYMHRGVLLALYNVLDFFVNTYEENIKKRLAKTNAIHESDDITQWNNNHVPYLPEYHKSRHKSRTIRQHNHRNLPNFVGHYFPRRDEPKTYDFYCASLLALLKPWRNLHTDLKDEDESWSEAYEKFLESAPKHIHRIVSGIQYFHECDTAAKEDNRREDPNTVPFFAESIEDDDHVGGEQRHVDGSEVETFDQIPEPTEQELVELLANQVPYRERRHAELAIAAAEQAGFFSSGSENQSWIIDRDKRARNAQGEDFERLLKWNAQMLRDIQRQNDPTAFNPETPSAGCSNDATTVNLLVPSVGLQSQVFSTEMAGVTVLEPEIQMPSIDPQMLNEKQYCAYQIIVNHLSETLAGRSPPPLRMILYGEGGTGKSKVIQTVTDAFMKAGKIFD